MTTLGDQIQAKRAVIIADGLDTTRPKGNKGSRSHLPRQGAKLMPRSNADILAQTRASIAARLEQASRRVDPETIEVMLALLSQSEILATELRELTDVRHSPGAAEAYPGLSVQIKDVESEIRQNRADLEARLSPTREEDESDASYAGRQQLQRRALEEAQQVMALRSWAYPMIEQLEATEEPDVATIDGFFQDSAEHGLVETTEDGSIFWKGGHYASTHPGDQVVSKVVLHLGRMVQNFRETGRARRDDVVTILAHAGFHMTNDDVKELRKHSDSVPLTDFLVNGNGRYSLVNCEHREVLVLERREDGVYPYKTTGSGMAMATFLFRDRESGEVQVRKNVWPIEYSVTDDDVSFGERMNGRLQGALESQLQYEAVAQERREEAHRLEDMSRVTNPLTTHDAVEDRQNGTCVMSYLLPEEDNGSWSRESPSQRYRGPKVTYHLRFDGENAWVADVAPGAIERADPDGVWLTKMTSDSPMPITELCVLPQWRRAVASNTHFESKWEATRREDTTDVTPVNAENVDGLVSVDAGVDGTYTLHTTSLRHVRGDARKSVPSSSHLTGVSFDVRRSGNELTLVWHSSSARSEAERMGSEPVQIGDMNGTWRAMMRNLVKSVKGMRGHGWWEKMPSHLQSQPQRRDENEGDNA